MTVGMDNEKGFSLIELVIVVSVLSIIAAVTAPQINKLITKSKISRIENELKTIKNAVNTLYADLGRYPRDIGRNRDPGLVSSSRVPTALRSGWAGPYLDRWPASHPWGGSYDYDYGRYASFNRDNSIGNEVFLTVRDMLTADILNRIDADLDDGNPLTGNIRHDARSTLRFYIGEGPRW